MIRQQRFILFVGCVAGIIGVNSVFAQPPAPEITKHHKMLKKDVGVWDAVMKLWIQGPGAEPTVSKSVERIRMLGDLWLISDFEGEAFGQKFSGHSQLGYDPQKKKYVGTWIDSASSSLSQMEGTYDEKTDVLTMTMTGIDSSTGEETTSKSTTKSLDENTRLFTMFMKGPGGDNWVKFMEIRYKRRAGK